MEKWKIIAIFLLLGSLVGYRAFNSQKPPAVPVVAPSPTVNPASAPGFPVMELNGKPAPDFAIARPLWMNTEQPVTLKSLKGSVVLLEFFRIECSHCNQAVPFMKSLHQTYTPRGLKIVAVQAPGTSTIENNWKNVQSWVKENGISYPVAFDTKAALFKTKYKGTNYPTMLLLDRNGVIKLIVTGHDSQKEMMLEEAIKNELGAKANQSATAPKP